MNEDYYLKPKPQSKIPVNEEMMNLRKIISLIISHKFFFIGSMIVTFAIAYLYNTYTIPVYSVSASILIEESKTTSTTGNDQFLEGFGLMPGMRNFDNQMMVLSSRTLISKTLDELPLDMEFFYRGFKSKKSLYPVQPIEIISEDGSRFPEDVEFEVKYKGNDEFKIKAESEGSFKLDKEFSFGQTIEIPGASFIIERHEPGFFDNKKNHKFSFILHSRRKLVASYVKRIDIKRATKLGSIVKISLKGTNKIEDLDFLNKMSEIFLNISLERKNNEANRTIQFIDDQLTGISDSLSITENKRQQFRSRNQVMNLSAQGQVIIDQAMNLENERARLGLEANYYEYLKGYLEKDATGEVPIAPATMGISDPGLTKLVADLADQQGRLYSKSMGEKNPLQSQYAQKVMATKDALKETLNGLSRANSLALKENEEQIKNINEKAYAIPRTERQLLGIERKYKINDELFTFLLEKRAVAQMQKASNVADNEMIEYPDYGNRPVSPRTAIIYLMALLTGIGFPSIWIFLSDIFNIRIKDLEDINKITDIPIIGYIPYSSAKNSKVVTEEPESPIAEAFRLLRSKMKFFTKDIQSPVILITSSMPSEGKTFSSINLALAYSMMGIKTVLVEFDLRRPLLSANFGFENGKGVSTYLIGKDKLNDIIRQTFPNLHIISSGPQPPNPAELTSLEKTAELFALLKERYECIIVDSSPIGIVSDTFPLASLVDVCILMVRPNLTIRDLFANSVNDLKISKIKSLSLVVNAIIPNGSQLGYGAYRYVYDGKQNKNGFRKISKNGSRNQMSKTGIFMILLRYLKGTLSRVSKV